MRRLAKAPSAGSNSGTGGKGRLLVLLLGIAACASLLFGAANASAYLTLDHEFGSAGSGDGQFNAAVGVATSESSGDVYVVDSANNRVQRFDSDGNYLSQFGSAGSGDGQFSEPQAVAIDQSDGSVYVVDMGNNRIEKFEPPEPSSKSSATPGSANGQLSAPPGVAVDPTSGDVLVADSANNRVQRFDPDGNYLSQFGEPGLFSEPSQLATDSTGSVYVVEQFSQIRKFDSGGSLTETVTANFPMDVAVDQANDHLFIVEAAGLSPDFFITERTASGALVESYDSFSVSDYRNGLAFNPVEGRAYYTESDHVVIWEESQASSRADGCSHLYRSQARRQDQPRRPADHLPLRVRADQRLRAEHRRARRSRPEIRRSRSRPPSSASPKARPTISAPSPPTPTAKSRGLTRPSPPWSGPAGGSETCPNADIRAAQGVTQVGDCRAFELVSPQEKNGANLTFAGGLSAPAGNAVTFQSGAGFAGAEGASHFNQYVARRGALGWTTEPLTPYMTPEVSGAFTEPHGYELFTPDFSRAVMFSKHDPNDLSANVEDDQVRLYLRTAGGGYQPISPPVTTFSSVGERLFYRGPVFAGASADLSRVFFESNRQLTPDAPPPGVNEVYEWADGVVSVVSVLPNGSVAPESARTGAKGGYLAESDQLRNAISGDGSEVVFETGTPTQLYLRTDGTTTTEISLSQKTGSVGNPSATPVMLMGSASEDGRTLSKVYFISEDNLTDDALTGPGSEGADLYEYDVSTGVLKDLVSLAAAANQSPSSAAVQSGWFGAAKDGDYLYFYVNGLYVEHAGTVTKVGDYIRPQNAFYTPQLSDDGKRALIFTPTELAKRSTDGFKQAYLYDAPSNSFECISCPVGHPPASQASSLFETLGGFTHTFRLQSTRNLSPDGKRAFFETGEALDPRDSNGQIDVYEWENGQVKLVSSGRGAEGAHFLDASSDGTDVFIFTYERMLPSDRDANVDVYDARVGGGLPLPPTPGAPCEGDACQNPPSPPNDATPASSAFKGAGNEKPRAKKGQHKKRKHARHKKKQKASAKQRAHARHTTRSHG